MPPSRKAWAVVVAAGAATRFGGDTPKQFVPVAGRPLVLWALDPFLAHPTIVGITLVVPGEHAARPPGWLADLRRRGVRVAAGGRTRSDSVRLGLETASEDVELVAVHDGARPLITTAEISRVLDAADGATGAIAARPVRDTLKVVNDASRIVRTVDRDGLWRAETPQAFDREVLVEVHRRAAEDGVTGSDCAALCERYGFAVRVVEVRGPNIKVTTAQDLALAEAWLEARGVRAGEDDDVER
jgi:2-C-methyl-D-erythritol 4-phosphate cytidylyltransferase